MTTDRGPDVVVDVHVHAVPHRLVTEASRGTFDGVEADLTEGAPVFRFPGMAPSPPMPRAILDTAAIGDRGAAWGVDLQLLGPWTDLFGYTLPERVAASWTRCYNEALVEECAGRAGMLPMATIPLTYPRLAAAELAEAHALGCRGVMVGTDVPGLHLGSPELDPVWEAASSLSMPVLVHPTYLEVPAELRGCGLKNAVGRAGPTAVSLAQVVYSGALVRFPGLSLIASHGGGAFAAVAPRVVRNHELGWSGSDHDPRESIRRLYYDSVVLDPGYLRYLAETFGADRFLLGSDYPFPWDPDPVATVTGSSLPTGQQQGILGGTAVRLFGLEKVLEQPQASPSP